MAKQIKKARVIRMLYIDGVRVDPNVIAVGSDLTRFVESGAMDPSPDALKAVGDAATVDIDALTGKAGIGKDDG